MGLQSMGLGLHPATQGEVREKHETPRTALGEVMLSLLITIQVAQHTSHLTNVRAAESIPPECGQVKPTSSVRQDIVARSWHRLWMRLVFLIHRWDETQTTTRTGAECPTGAAVKTSFSSPRV